jgi:mannose-1-phosphate guanylyltransferase / mannose-6-phosphate isomerase
LAGGGGTRLWPLSTDIRPKQFVDLPGINQSLFLITLKRAMRIVDVSDICVITSDAHRELILESALKEGIDIRSHMVFGESKRLNTLPATMAGLALIKPLIGEKILVLPSDHIIDNEDEFKKSVELLSVHMNSTSIGVFGIKPSSPHTGYGYIKPENEIASNLYSVDSFQEKPSLEKAVQYVKDGYYWNSGMFLFEATHFLSLVEKYQHEIYESFSSFYPEEAYLKLNHGISIDYGIMEHTNDIVLVSMSNGWTDIGSFETLSELVENDDNVSLIESNNVTVINGQRREVVVVGLDDVIVVDHHNGLLITKKGKSQKVNQRKK